MSAIVVRPTKPQILEARLARALKKGRPVTVTWDNRHTWTAVSELYVSREAIEVAPDDILEYILVFLEESGARTNYRHYWNWSRVQLVLTSRIKKTPQSEFDQPIDIHSVVLNRRGLGFVSFLHSVVRDMLREIGQSFYLTNIIQISIHHYR